MRKKPFRHKVSHKDGDASRKTVEDGGKVCSGCDIFFDLTNFYPIRRKDKDFTDFSPKCKFCFRQAHAQWMKDNKEHYIAKIAEWSVRTGDRKRRNDKKAYTPVIQLISMIGWKLDEVNEAKIGWLAEETGWTRPKIKRAIAWAKPKNV